MNNPNSGLMNDFMQKNDQSRDDIYKYRQQLMSGLENPTGMASSFTSMPANKLGEQINSGQSRSNQNVSNEKDFLQGLRGKLDGSIGWKAQMQNNEYSFQENQKNLDRQHQLGVMDKDFNFRGSQADLDRQHQIGVMDKDFGFKGTQADLDRELSREKMDNDDSTLAQSTTANTQGKYLDAINQITQNTMLSINEIEVTPGMTQEDKDAMIANTIARRDADLAWVRQLYSNMPTWDFSWLNTQPGEMPSAPGIGV